MTRTEFWDWLESCPDDEWFVADIDDGGIRVFFPVDADDETEE